MMDLKEIIKWFIPCFHILRVLYKMLDYKMTFLMFLFLLNLCCASGIETKNSFSYDKSSFNNRSDGVFGRELAEVSGRTFGLRFKKIMQALLPVVFQVGAASTWAVVAALIGIKTLAVTLLILKLLLVAGAAKIGALFAEKKHSHHGWSPQWEPHPSKEIHLHIHNGKHEEHHSEEHVPISTWNREGTASASENKVVNVVLDPYAGPQTISTPYGNYVRVQPPLQSQAIPVKRKRRTVSATRS